MSDVELILRFFALDYYHNKSEKSEYPESRGETLNNYMREQVKKSSIDTETLTELLNKALKVVDFTFQGNQFKSYSIKKDKAADFSPQINAAVFDLQMLGFLDYDLNRIMENKDIFYDAFLDLCSYDKYFIDAISRSTNSKVNQRISIWQNKINHILDNEAKYRERFNDKKRLFNESPICYYQREPIQRFEDADYYNGQLYCRWNSPQLGMRTTIETKSDVLQIQLNGELIDFDNIKEAFEFMGDYISEKIKDDEHDVARLSQLTFIGSQEYLLARITGKKHIKRFGELTNETGKQLYINIGGTKKENLQNLEELISLFGFLKDCQIKI